MEENSQSQVNNIKESYVEDNATLQGKRFGGVFVYGTVAFVVVVIIGATTWFMLANKKEAPLTKSEPVNHLIPGVPYYGITNLYPDYTSAAVSVATILRYYNDERVSFSDLWNTFKHDIHGDRPGHSAYFQNFFDEQGYMMQIIGLANVGPNTRIDIIKEYIKQDAPVVIHQDKSPDDSWGFFRVVIGIFDDRKELVVHDMILGNNYTFSYEKFNELFTTDRGYALVVSPKEALKAQLSAPGTGEPYPDKQAIYETLPNLVEITGNAKWTAARARTLCEAMIEEEGAPSKEDVDEHLRLNQESINYRDQAISHPLYKDMTKLFQYRQKMWKAKSLLKMGRTTEAREILTKELIPENHDLTESTGELEVLDASDIDSLANVVNGTIPYTYTLLSISYAYEGNFNAAADALLPKLEILSDDTSVLNKMERLRDPEVRMRPTAECFGGYDNII